MTTLFAGLDVSQATTAICVVDERGDKHFEATVATDPVAIATALRPYRRLLAQVGHETGLYTPFLHRELLRRRFPALCLDARKTRAVLAAQRNKTDRNDARDIAIALSHGFKGEAFVKSVEAHRLRALLACRRALKRRARDLDGVLRGTAKAFGCRYKDGKLTAGLRGSRVDPFVANVAASVLRARTAVLAEALALEQTVILGGRAAAVLTCQLPHTRIDDVAQPRRLACRIGEPVCRPDTMDAPAKTLKHALPISLARRRNTMTLIGANGVTKAHRDDALIRAITRARAWVKQLEAGAPKSIIELARSENLCKLHTAKLLPLAFLAPDLVEMVLDGRQPPRMTLTALIAEPLPESWAGQRARFAEFA